MPNTEATKKITKAVDDGFDAQLKFTADLTRLPSLRGQEATAQDFMARAYRDRGLPSIAGRSRSRTSRACRDSRRWPSPMTMPGTWSARTGRRRLQGQIADPQRPYRRGADRPAGHVDHAALRAAHQRRLALWPRRRRHEGRAGGESVRVRRAAPRRPAAAADIYLQSVIEEECTGNGALACLQRGYRADAAHHPRTERHPWFGAGRRRCGSR